MSNNQVIPYHKESVQKAKDLARLVSTPLSAFLTITKYVSRNFVYDYIKAIKIAKQPHVLPDIETTWKNRMGVCQDLSAMTVGMLRGIGIEAYMCVGKAGKRIRHAWVEANIGGKKYRYDYNGKAPTYVVEKRY